MESGHAGIIGPGLYDRSYIQYLRGPAGICTEHEERNGMKYTPYLVCGDSFFHPESHMGRIGITGGQSRKLTGERITNCG